MSTSSLLREDNEKKAVSPLELFFDLIYVFAIAELSHHLVLHLDLKTAIESLLIALAVIYAWYTTVWLSNWLRHSTLAVRLLLLTLTFVGLVMSTSIAESYTDRAWIFVAAYLVMQLMRTGFALFAFKGHDMHRHFVHTAVWETGAAVLWIAGAVRGGHEQLVLWALAIVVTYPGSALGHPVPGSSKRVRVEDAEIEGHHLIERFRLFFLIALGETVLTTGTAFVSEEFTLLRFLTLAVSFTGTAALWWCYFQRLESIGLDAADDDDDAGDVGKAGTWTLILLVLGIISIAVGDELAIAHPDDPVTVAFALLAFAGSALFLVGQIWFEHTTTGRISRARVIAIVVLAVLAAAAYPFTLLVSIAVSNLVLVGVAVADARRAEAKGIQAP